MVQRNHRLRVKIVEVFETQQRFAQASGLDPGIVSGLVQGYRLPTEEQLEVITRLLKTDRETLFGGGAAA